MSKNSPAFQFYPADFLVGTAEMTAEEVGGYIRLLCYQWTKGSLPNDDRKLMQLALVFDLNVMRSIKTKFTRQEDGTIVNLKLQKVRLEQDQFREKQREKAQKRWDSKTDATASSGHENGISQNDALQPLTYNLNSIPSPTPSVITEKPKRFIPPTYQEVVNYCIERKNKVDPQRFIDHYTSNGWMVGKNKMKNWKAAIHTWEKNNFNTTANGTTGTKQPIDWEQRDRAFVERVMGSGQIDVTSEGDNDEPFTSFEDA